MSAKDDKIDPYAELDYRPDALIELRRVRKLKIYRREHIHLKEKAQNGI